MPKSQLLSWFCIRPASSLLPSAGKDLGEREKRRSVSREILRDGDGKALLLDLPPGVFVNMCQYLSRPARAALRATCRQLLQSVSTEGVRELTATAGATCLWEKHGRTSAPSMSPNRQFRTLMTLLPQLDGLVTLHLTLGRSFSSKLSAPMVQLRSATPKLQVLKLTVLCTHLSPELLGLVSGFKNVHTLDLQALGWYDGHSAAVLPTNVWLLAPNSLGRTIKHLRLGAVNPLGARSGCFINDAELGFFNSSINLMSLEVSGVLSSEGAAANVTADAASLRLLSKAPALRRLALNTLALPRAPSRKLLLTAVPCSVRIKAVDLPAPGTPSAATAGPGTPQHQRPMQPAHPSHQSLPELSGPPSQDLVPWRRGAPAIALEHMSLTSGGTQLQRLWQESKALCFGEALRAVKSLQLTVTSPLLPEDLEVVGNMKALRRLCLGQALGKEQLEGLGYRALGGLEWLRLRANLATGEMAMLLKSGVLTPTCQIVLGGVVGLSWRANTHGLAEDAVALAAHEGGYCSELLNTDNFTSITGNPVEEQRFIGLKLNLDACSINRDVLGEALAPLLPTLEGLVCYTSDNPAHAGRVFTSPWLRYNSPNLRLLGAWQTSDMGELMGRALLRASHKHLLPLTTRSSFQQRGWMDNTQRGRDWSSCESDSGNSCDTPGGGNGNGSEGSEFPTAGRRGPYLGCTPLKTLVLVGTDPVTSIMTQGAPAMCLQEVLALVGAGFKLQLIMTPGDAAVHTQQINALQVLRAALRDYMRTQTATLDADSLELHIGTIG